MSCDQIIFCIYVLMSVFIVKSRFQHVLQLSSPNYIIWLVTSIDSVIKWYFCGFIFWFLPQNFPFAHCWTTRFIKDYGKFSHFCDNQSFIWFLPSNKMTLTKLRIEYCVNTTFLNDLVIFYFIERFIGLDNQYGSNIFLSFEFHSHSLLGDFIYNHSISLLFSCIIGVLFEDISLQANKWQNFGTPRIY